MEHPCFTPPFFDSFNLRSDVRMGKRYLEGRYGGVPILSTTRALSAIEKGTDDMPPLNALETWSRRSESIRCVVFRLL